MVLESNLAKERRSPTIHIQDRSNKIELERRLERGIAPSDHRPSPLLPLLPIMTRLLLHLFHCCLPVLWTLLALDECGAFLIPAEHRRACPRRPPLSSFSISAKSAPRETQEADEPASTLSEDERLQMEFNATMMGDSSYMGFTPNNFDSEQLPIPLFTAILVLLFSLYATFYGIYVGLNGFPVADESGLPRVF